MSADGKTASAVATIAQQFNSVPNVEVAAAGDHRFALWSTNNVLAGTPIGTTGTPLVPQGFPLLASIRA